MNKYDTGNYNYCTKNTTAVWNLTPPPANLAQIPQQHVIHQASDNIRYHCVNFQSFFSFWIACDTPSIKVDTTEQQSRQLDLTSRTYIYTTDRQQNTLISTTSGETFNTIYNTNQKNKNCQVHLGPITTHVHILQDLYNPPDYFGYYVK